MDQQAGRTGRSQLLTKNVPTTIEIVIQLLYNFVPHFFRNVKMNLQTTYKVLNIEQTEKEI